MNCTGRKACAIKGELQGKVISLGKRQMSQQSWCRITKFYSIFAVLYVKYVFLKGHILYIFVKQSAAAALERCCRTAANFKKYPHSEGEVPLFFFTFWIFYLQELVSKNFISNEIDSEFIMKMIKPGLLSHALSWARRMVNGRQGNYTT